MLDITKSRNNYPKFPTTLKQKCEPGLMVQQKHQQQSKQSNTSKSVATTAKKQTSSIYCDLKPSLAVRQIGGNINGRSVGVGRGVPVASKIEAAQQRIQPSTSTPNAVREANQQFFLLPEYQDKNFLKNECAIAHAQVAPAAITYSNGKRSIATKSVNTKKSIAAELKDAIVIRQCCTNNNNNNNNNSSTCCSLSHQQNQLDSTRLNPVKATATNVVRRSAAGVCSSNGYGNTLDSITTTSKPLTKDSIVTNSSTPTSIPASTTKGTTTTTAHRFEVQFNSVESTLQSKAVVPQITSTTKVQLPSLSSLSNNNQNIIIGRGTNLVNNKTLIKPLVHRSTIPTTVTIEKIRSNSGERQAYTNSINNNHSSNSSNNTGQQYNLSNGNNDNFTNNNSMAAPTSSVVRALDHEDIKYIDSDENTGMTPAPPPSALLSTGGTATGNMGKFVECVEPPLPGLINKPTNITSSTRMRPKSTIISSNNPNVFEKINNYKLTNGGNTIAGDTNYASKTTTATTASSKRPQNTNIDSNSIKASIAKFNNFSEQKRLPLAMPNAVTLRANAGGTGSTSNLQYHRHSGSDFDSGNLRQCMNNNVGSGGGGGSLTRNPYRTSSALTSNIVNSVAQNMPLKTRVRMTDASTTTATTTYKQTNKLHDERRLQENANTATEKLTVTGDESIRSVGTKSLLPPASPTTSRYWDRDRTTSLSLSSTNHNHLDADKSSNDEKSEGLCGLRNIGNTCFMNSIIQCLSHTNELTKFLRNYRGMSSSSVTKDQQILQEFAKLIREMWTNNVHSVTPMDLKRAFSLKHRMYSDYNQQDAQEFLRFFLDSLHSALNSGVKGEPLNIDDNLSDNKKADLTWEWYARHENSLIRDLFVGQLKSTLKCTICGNTSNTFDPFWDLSVSLPSSSRCKLDACFELFIREEVLDGDEMPTCAKCKTRRKCTKSFSIQRFPKYLVIHLKRFSETRWSKLSNIVEFPTGERELNMAPYGANPNANIHYSLYAISNHMGSTAGGHYVALCKHPVSRKWHEFNDNIVSDPLSESHLVSSSAYILFYERA